MFCAFQTSNLSNGGIESLTQIVRAISSKDNIILTQKFSPRSSAWQAEGFNVKVIKSDIDSGGRGHGIKLFSVIRRIFKIIP